MADFMHKALPTYTAEHPSKYVVEQEYDTPAQVPVAVTPNRKSRDDEDDDAETIYLRELGTLRFRDKQYGIRKEGTTLMIGNSEVDLEKPGVFTVKGKQFKLTKGIVGPVNT
jgi:hypothetical protein